jgi:hypothetical protein
MTSKTEQALSRTGFRLEVQGYQYSYAELQASFRTPKERRHASILSKLLLLQKEATRRCSKLPAGGVLRMKEAKHSFSERRWSCTAFISLILCLVDRGKV